MALSVKVGSVAAKTTTGSQAYTGVGFQPKALFLFITNRTAVGTTTSINQLGYGMMSASAARACAFTSRNGGVTAGNISEEARMVSGALTLLNTFGSVHIEATLTSLDADGFTLNYGTVNGSANMIGYLAIGGADVTNVACGDFLTGTSTGNVDVTGLGFNSPDLVVLAHVGDGGALPEAPVHSQFGIGMGVSASQRWASVRQVRNGVIPTEGASQQVNTAILLGLTSTNTADMVADYSGGITDGFRINISDAPAADRRVSYLAIKGGSYSTGLETQKTSTGTKDTVVTGTPKGVFFAGTYKTAGSGIDTGISQFSVFGASDNTSEECVSGGTADAVSTADTYCSFLQTGAIHKKDIAGTTTSQANANFSLNTLQLDWTTADAVATEFGYLTIADTVSAPSTARLLAATGVGT